MIKKLALVFIVLFTIQNYAQQGTASPYSFYGIGSLKFKGTAENRSMGGLSIYMDSIHINLRNPASNVADDVSSYPFNGKSRPVRYTVGGSQSGLNLKSSSGSDRATSTTFDYLALTIPIGKFGVGFGLLPQTSVGYKLETVNSDGDLENKFAGEGGLNKVFLGVGYKLLKGLNIGINANYNFGNIKNSVIEYAYDVDGELLQYQSLENNRSDLSGLSFNIGLAYKKIIRNKYEFVSGVTFSPESNLTSNNQRIISTFSINTNTSNKFDVDLDALGLKKTELTLPSKLSFGAGFGQPRVWFVGAEYTTENTSKFYNPLYSNLTTKYENASNFSFGGFFIPQYNSFNNYLKRIVYRAGMHFEKTGLNINNESIKEFGISFGLGLPVGNFFSNANLGLEIGKRGTTNSNLVQENFVNFQLSLSLNDRWFQKRKYD